AGRGRRLAGAPLPDGLEQSRPSEADGDGVGASLGAARDHRLPESLRRRRGAGSPPDMVAVASRPGGIVSGAAGMARVAAIRRTFARRRVAGTWLLVMAVYMGLAALTLLLTSAISRGGSLPDSVELQWMQMIPAMWDEVYWYTVGSCWVYL